MKKPVRKKSPKKKPFRLSAFRLSRLEKNPNIFILMRTFNRHANSAFPKIRFNTFLKRLVKIFRHRDKSRLLFNIVEAMYSYNRGWK